MDIPRDLYGRLAEAIKNKNFPEIVRLRNIIKILRERDLSDTSEGPSISKPPEIIEPVEKFIVSDEDEKIFPKNLFDFIARCKEIEKKLSGTSSYDFAEVVFKFFRDSDMINEKNIKSLTDEEFCEKNFNCKKSILKLIVEKTKDYFEHMHVVCNNNSYYVLKNCWYVQTDPEISQKFYKWILKHAWKKFEQIKSKDICKDIAEFVKNKPVVHSKYLSELFRELAEESEQNNLNRAIEFYKLAIKFDDSEPLKILHLAKFYGEEKISDKILNYIRRNLYQIKTADIFERVVDFVEKNKSSLQLKSLSEIFSKLAEKMEKREDLNRAVEFYKLAIKFDDKNSLKILQLAKTYEKSGRFNDAFWQYSSLKNTSQQEQAADRINVMGCNFNSKKDYKSAEICFEAAANMGNVNAMNNLGCYLLEKRGTRLNEDEGFDWLYKAAYGFGNMKAKYNLERYLNYSH